MLHGKVCGLWFVVAFNSLILLKIAMAMNCCAEFNLWIIPPSILMDNYKPPTINPKFL